MKQRKLRITVFLTCNADGSEKLPPMVIGRSKNPVAFRQAHINHENLPVKYWYNKKAWMFSGIWYEYLGVMGDRGGRAVDSTVEGISRRDGYM